MRRDNYFANNLKKKDKGKNHPNKIQTIFDWKWGIVIFRIFTIADYSTEIKKKLRIDHVTELFKFRSS